MPSKKMTYLSSASAGRSVGTVVGARASPRSVGAAGRPFVLRGGEFAKADNRAYNSVLLARCTNCGRQRYVCGNMSCMRDTREDTPLVGPSSRPREKWYRRLLCCFRGG